MSGWLQYGFANQVVAALQAGNTIINNKGDFVYSPTPGKNNLLLSIAPANGQDQFGNQYLQGETVYGFGFGIWFAMQMNSAGDTWYIGGATQSVPYTPVGTLGFAALNPGVTLAGGPRAGNSFIIGDGGLGGQIRMVFLAPSGDVSGATDTSNINAAIDVVTSPGQNSFVNLLFGTWYTNGQISLDFGQYVDGAGFGNTILNYKGSGDAFRQTHAGAYSAANIGGGVRKMTIDGASHAAGASSGIHAGDIESLDWDGLQVRNFNQAGDIGYHFDNTVAFTERMTGRIRSNNNTQGVVFDVSGALTSSGSFARAILEILISSGDISHDGVVFQNGALMYDQDLMIKGNFTAGSAGPFGAVLVLTGTVPAGHPGAGNPSRINGGSPLNIGVETGSGVVKPQTIRFGASSNFIDARGTMDFGSTNLFQQANPTGDFRYSGRIIGDPSLVATSYYGTNVRGAIANGQTIFTNTGGVVSVAPIANVTGIILSAAAFDSQEVTIKNLSSFTLTFDVPATSNVAQGVSAVIPALGRRTFTWDTATALWY